MTRDARQEGGRLDFSVTYDASIVHPGCGREGSGRRGPEGFHAIEDAAPTGAS